MRTVRSTLVVAAVAVLAATGTALAQPPGPRALTVPDPVGDSTSTAATDLTGVTFTTTGIGKGRKYTPTALVVTLSLVRRPASDARTIYRVQFDVPGCGTVHLRYVPGSTVFANSYNEAACGSAADALGDTSTRFDGEPQLDGTDLVWTLPLTELPFPTRPGTTFSGLHARTNMVEPVFGQLSPSLITGEPPYDVIDTARRYTVG